MFYGCENTDVKVSRFRNNIKKTLKIEECGNVQLLYLENFSLKLK